MQVSSPAAAALPVVLVLASLSACGGNEITMPPLTPEPVDSRLAGTSDTPPEQSLAARLVLYRFLHGVAAGNVRVCAHLAPAFERAAFGGPGRCRSGLRQARARLRPPDIAALRGVTVPVAEDGPGDGDYTVRFEDLKWRGEPARPGGLLAARFTLRKTGGRWLITM
ncbi:hypothetical protein [Actinomadura rubrisoli]|uniref:Nuclear transport factor 2 family protein n=1 Tax=Actinomadura rubrisoli TaxID=2530368 RepID=A0A4R5B9B7_9ACTN|nr:hypothetical protein [Actinomadura rubrisoli]TDD81240.1 hypothetical protein E1298_24485 [Actinomadura rubrisoli]